ncbi:4-hydroxy-tetrahydrodipicolinate synthase [Candidatus Odyssella acanthamoebae]|uniref:4-hydroxy-tetrahydrodipicolinate synthase n=1 Tax=Candidatus Odyssella acanthamoebae TaxID=91604 RepID=A0A077AUF4_9PROT|nr:4-hydroxy-tetrahydrodipicolinate synthase [Candidatus Paracaedibacter acanthamoebae]AIK96817.1 dihydrodipicolinate synthase [Candidatus Paracaedibacter acanthamoebae]
MKLSGSIVALITPFHNGEVNVTALKNLVEWHLAEGTQGIVACGSTGEAALLTTKERRVVLETVVAAAAGRIPVIAGCGAPSTHETLAMMVEAKEIGCDAALVVTPYYVKPMPEGVYQHFKVLNDVGLPIVLYNNPGRAVTGLSVDTVVRLAELSMVIAIKDSCDDLTRVIKMRQRIMKDFSFLSGDDPIATAYIAQGGDGVVSVSANVVPRLNQQIMQAWKSKDLETFATLRDKLLMVHESMFVETSPSPIKYAVSRLGFCGSEVRLPLVPVTESAKEIVDHALKTIGLVAA